MGIAEVNLPEEMDRSFMLSKVFKTTFLNYDYRNGKKTEEMIERYRFTTEEIKKPVGEAYATAVSGGHFSRAIQIRERFEELIEDPEVSPEQLRHLEGIMNYTPDNTSTNAATTISSELL